VSLAGRRYDAKSTWTDGTSTLSGRGLQPLTTIGPRIKTVTFANPQGDLVWKAEQPIDGSLPPRFTCFNYDGEHHLLETILPEGNSLITSYDGEWRPLAVTKGMRGVAPTGAWATQCLKNASNWTGPFETVGVTEYGPGGWVRSVTAENVKTAFVTDGFGRPLEERSPAGVSSARIRSDGVVGLGGSYAARRRLLALREAPAGSGAGRADDRARL